MSREIGLARWLPTGRPRLPRGQRAGPKVLFRDVADLGRGRWVVRMASQATLAISRTWARGQSRQSPIVAFITRAPTRRLML